MSPLGCRGWIVTPFTALVVLFFFLGSLVAKPIFGDNPIVIVTSGTISASVFLFFFFWLRKKEKLEYKKEIDELKKVKEKHKHVLEKRLVEARTKRRKGRIALTISLVVVLVLLGYIMIYQTSTPLIIIWFFIGASAGLAITGMYARYYHHQVMKYEAASKSSEP